MSDTLCGTVGAVHDLAFTAHDRVGNEERRVRVWLAGAPAWRWWKYHLRYFKNGRLAQETLSAYDGRYYCMVQADGLGFILSDYNAPHAYYSYVGIYLGNLGLGPALTGSADNWQTVISERPDLAVRDDAERPGIVYLDEGTMTRVLDARYGFMPLRAQHLDSAGHVWREFVYTDYQQFGPLWLPRQMRQLPTDGNAMECEITDVKVNQGLRAEDMRWPIPFGTSLSLDGDVIRRYGLASADEREEALHNWLAYGPEVGRRTAQTTPVEQLPMVTAHAAYGPLFFLANVLLGTAVLFAAFATSQRRRRAAAAALGAFALGFPGGAHAETMPEMGSPDSLGNVTYVTLVLYGRDTPLTTLCEELGARAGAAELAGAAERLQRAGVQVEEAVLSLEQLERWPHPVLVELKPRGMVSFTRYAIVLGCEDGRFTLIDPNAYGRLAPWTRAELEERWSGRVVLTAPTPIGVSRPWRTISRASVGFPLLAMIYLLIRRRIARVTAVSACLMGALALTGCTESSSPAPLSFQPAGSLALSATEWLVESTYPETVRREFTLTNAGMAPISITQTKASCGCMAYGLPEGVTVQPGQQYPFELSITLVGSRGPVKHTLDLTYSDGTSQTIRFSANVVRGVYPEPAELAFQSNLPAEIVTQVVRLVSDDGRPFEIMSATTDSLGDVRIDQDAKQVAVSVRNENRQAALRDTLVITTSHDHAKTLRVPVRTSFKLTWETRPTGFFFHENDGGEYVERTVQVMSKVGAAFLVAPSTTSDLEIAPLATEAAAQQEVRIRLRRPTAGSPPRRQVVALRTTLPDAAEVEVPFVFYR